MHELLPIAGGLALGASLRFIKASLRLPVALALGTAIAVLAFVASGEFLLSWGFLLIDLGGTALAVATGQLASTWWAARRSRQVKDRSLS
jgi:hypothetical protein